MKLNLKNSILSVIVLASLVGCGSDGGGGAANFDPNGAYNGTVGSNSFYMGNVTSGGPVQKPNELIDSIVKNKFQYRNSIQNYVFMKTTASISSDSNCDEFDIFGINFGQVCTSSSSSSSFNNDNYGIRRIDSNGKIIRNVSIYSEPFTYYEDEKFGSSLSELANILASKITTAKNQGKLYKYISGQFYEISQCSSFPNHYFCTSYSAVWGFVDGNGSYVIDLSKNLASQPVARSRSGADITPY